MVLPRTPLNVATASHACIVAQPCLGIGCLIRVVLHPSMPERALGAIEYALESCLSGTHRLLMEGEDATVSVDGAEESVDDAS
jgi:hypothetical protein